MTTPKRAAIYCRVSTTLQATDEKTSLQHQERLCRERAAEDGMTIMEEYVIRDASSGSVRFRRPEGVATLTASGRA